MTGTGEFDFDATVDRRGTSSEKWRMYEKRGVLPLWLADMDFRSPPAVIDALRRRVEHGVFGYTVVPDALVEAVISMLLDSFGWEVKPEWLIWLPSLVTGLNVACRAVGAAGDEVLTAIPVYPPFLSAPGYSHRVLATVPLLLSGGIWELDFDWVAGSLGRKTRLFLLCNPHNPVGRVFSRKELTTLSEIWLRNDVVICSDEIHCGLVLDADKTHVPTATLGAEVADRTITLMSPSKTFNLPGLGCSFAIIPNEKLRRSFRGARRGVVPPVNALAFAAAIAAYRDGSGWLEALLDYLRRNRDLVADTVDKMPGLSLTHVEATYLAWIDARGTGLDRPATFFEQAGVGLADGADFRGPGFLRLTFGCPRSTLVQALNLMQRAVELHGEQWR